MWVETKESSNQVKGKGRGGEFLILLTPTLIRSVSVNLAELRRAFCTEGGGVRDEGIKGLRG